MVTIAVGSVGDHHVRARDAESLAVGLAAGHPDGEVLDEAGRLAASAAEPDSDSNGSAAYKTDLVRVLVGRALRQALDHALADGAAA